MTEKIFLVSPSLYAVDSICSASINALSEMMTKADRRTYVLQRRGASGDLFPFVVRCIIQSAEVCCLRHLEPYCRHLR